MSRSKMVVPQLQKTTNPVIDIPPKGSFTTNWFVRRARLFRELMLPLAGKPITYVEIGMYEGASSCWTCENILTHPDSRGIGIDPWSPKDKKDTSEKRAVRDTAYANLKPWSNFTIIEKPSLAALRDDLEIDSVDVLYIDGNHWSHGCMLDAMNGWPLVKVGGLIIFDDYQKRRRHKNHVFSAVRAIMMSMALCTSDWVMLGEQIACIKTGPPTEKLFKMTMSEFDQANS